MTVQQLANVGIVVADLASAVEFFQVLGLELEGRATIELTDQRVEIAMMRTPTGMAGSSSRTFSSRPPSRAVRRRVPTVLHPRPRGHPHRPAEQIG